MLPKCPKRGSKMSQNSCFYKPVLFLMATDEERERGCFSQCHLNLLWLTSRLQCVAKLLSSKIWQQMGVSFGCPILYLWPKHLKNSVIRVALQITKGNRGTGRSSRSVAELEVHLGSHACCWAIVAHHPFLPVMCFFTTLLRHQVLWVCERSSVVQKEEPEVMKQKPSSVGRSFQCAGFCASSADSSLQW